MPNEYIKRANEKLNEMKKEKIEFKPPYKTNQLDYHNISMELTIRCI